MSGNEKIRQRDVSLGEPGTLSVEYSGPAEGEESEEEFALPRGSAIVIEGPDGFMMTYRVPGPEEESNE